jgi:hypothetical protein
LERYRTVGDRDGEANTLAHIGSTFEKSQPELGIFFAKQAVNILQTIRRDNRGLEDSLRKSFEKSIESNYRYLAGLLVDRQRFGEAEEVLNLLKDKEAADFIRRDAVSDQLNPATLLDSERQALDRYEQILTGIISEGAAKSALVAKAAKTQLSAVESVQSQQLDRDLLASNTVLLRFFEEEEKSFAANSAAAKRVGEMRESEGLQDALQALGPDAQIVRAREAEPAVDFRRNVVVAHLLAQSLGESRGHLRAGQVFAGDPDRLAGVFTAVLEDAVGARSDIVSGNAGEFLVAHGKGDGQMAVETFARAHPKVDEVVPIERGQQQGGGYTRFHEVPVGFTLRVEVRHLVFAVECRHAVIAQGHPLA